jgi:uncharacterized protein YndB with AHSA1/START domain
MGITLRAPRVDRRIGAPPEAVWRVLTDIEQWPLWGPSVRRAELHGGGTEVTAAARGTGRRWDWTVAGVPATGHEVIETPGGCVVRFETPWWAVAYLPVCAAALARIEGLVR